MDPFTVAGLVSGGLGAVNALFGPDIDEENRRLMEEYQGRIDQRTAQALALASQWKSAYDDALSVLEPRLGFGQRQQRMAGREGARAAQASVRRSLGTGGDVFGAAIGAGLETGADMEATTLSALARSAAIEAAQNQALARAGFVAGAPVAPPPQFTGQKSAMTTGLLANFATGLGYLGTQRQKNVPRGTTLPGRGGVPLAPQGQPGAFTPFIGPARQDGSF